MSTLTKGDKFTAKVVSEIFSKVAGKSSLAKLSAQSPIPFNGIKEFTFGFDKEIDIVAENGAKGVGGVSVTPVTIVPIKVEYGARITDEFMNASEEEAMNILQSWIDGFTKKIAKGFDIMAMHGVNPRTGSASDVIGNNYFDYALSSSKTTYDSSAPDDNLTTAVSAVQANGYEVTGMALAPAFATALAAMKANGVSLYPEFKFGQNPDSFSGMQSDVNGTVSFNSGVDRAIVGDFANAFKWGIAKEIDLEVIEYGNPDNDADAGDLKGHNQVYLRGEAYIGWGILDANAFNLIAASSEPVITT